MILGANLTRLDDFTKSLITNKEVIAISQNAVTSKEHSTYPETLLRPRRWSATTGGPHPQKYIAIFNLHDRPLVSEERWLMFGLADKDHAVYDVWNQKQVPGAKTLHVDIPAHGCALFRVE
jgi:hypothetical protein